MNKLFLVFSLLLMISISNAQWVLVRNGNGNQDVVAMISGSGYILAGFTGSDSPGILKSTNNGQSWTQTSMNFQRVNCFCKVGNNLFAGCYNFGVYISSDNGVNWVQTSLNNKSIYSLALSGNNLLAGTGDSGLYKSTDNGNSWIRTSLFYPQYTTVISLLSGNNNVVYAGTVQNTNHTYKSTNNGLNWSPMSLENKTAYCFAEVGSYVFSGVQTYIPFGSVNSIWASSNNGATWYLSRDSTRVEAMLAVNNCVIADQYVSCDFGQTWTLRNEGYSFNVRSLCILEDYIFGGGNGGYIYRRPLSEIIGIQTISTEIPDNFSLSQNYPNPFNPVTYIDFDIVKNEKVKISVYDILGREVTILVNKELPAGSYRIDWNASNYPSGIYFYKMETDFYNETKRMVLAK